MLLLTNHWEEFRRSRSPDAWELEKTGKDGVELRFDRLEVFTGDVAGAIWRNRSGAKEREKILLGYEGLRKYRIN